VPWSSLTRLSDPAAPYEKKKRRKRKRKRKKGVDDDGEAV
jgi:hypothetical protein